MTTILSGIIIAFIIFIGFQIIMPFPYGIILGIVFAGIIVWYVKKHPSKVKNSKLI